MGPPNKKQCRKAKESFRQLELFQKAKKLALDAGVPPKQLERCTNEIDVKIVLKDWYQDPAYHKKIDESRRTSDHNRLLRFMEWYIARGQDYPDKVDHVKRALPCVRRGDSLHRHKWLFMLESACIGNKTYTPPSPKLNLTRKKAPWS